MTTIHHRLLAAICAVLLLGSACSSGADTATAELPTLADSTEETADASSDDDAEGAEDTESDDATADDADGAADGSGGDDEEVDPEIAMAEYEKCMQDQGLDVQMATAGEGSSSIETLEPSTDESDNGGSIEDFSIEDFEAAEEVCGPILEDAFGSFELTPEQEAEMADEMLELSRCMSEQGFDIELDQGVFELDEDIDFEAFENAMSTCGNGIGVMEEGQ